MHATTCMYLKDIIPSERSQSKKMLYDSTYISTWSSQNHRDRKQKSSCQALGGERNGEILLNGYRVSVLQDKEVLWMDVVRVVQ